METFRTIVAVVVLVSLLSACGIGDSPEKAAREWLDALLNMDGNKLMERTCAEQQEAVQEAGLWVSFTGEQIEADVSDLRFKTVYRSGDTARVRVTGEIRTAILAVATVEEVDEEWQMVREDGKWKWCNPEP
jgi:hypothetical protein